MKSFVVVGLGRFGMEIAKQLYQQGREVLAIDNNPELVERVTDSVTQAVVANAQDKEVLRALGVKDFDCAIVAIGNSLSDSVLATMNLKELGVSHVVCKASDETHCQVLKKLGADRVVIPEKEQAIRLAKSLSSRNVLDYIELSEDYGIVDLPAPKSWCGKSLIELNVRAKLGLNILAIKRNGDVTVSPGAQFCLVDGDILVVLGDTAALRTVQKL